uniref:GRASP55_65 domain-containing protein n=1 Tax=Soboliphyme baturini TaxID=241478 RepID=A0A183IFV5_9BILA
LARWLLFSYPSIHSRFGSKTSCYRFSGSTVSVKFSGKGFVTWRRLLSVQENSPGQQAGLEPFFDFIIGVGNQRLDKDNDVLKEILKQYVERPLDVVVYNSKTQTVRHTEITPSQKWGGQGLLGVSIRFCSFDGANQNVWHILNVQPNSPAFISGLQPEIDYILGAESVLNEVDDLFSLIQANEGKSIKLYVYNINSDTVREVTLTPVRGWGGEGSLGCDIGYGYLHRIPAYREPANTVVIKPLTINSCTLTAATAQPPSKWETVRPPGTASFNGTMVPPPPSLFRPPYMPPPPPPMFNPYQPEAQRSDQMNVQMTMNYGNVHYPPSSQGIRSLAIRVDCFILLLLVKL